MKHALQKYMFRRTHENQLFGAPILKLPRAFQNNLEIELSRLEYLIYVAILDKYTTEFMTSDKKKDNSAKGILFR
jgi:hypothetical protein